MPLPTGLVARRLTFGPYVLADGSPAKGTVKVTPRIEPGAIILHIPTGTPIVDGTVEVKLDTAGVGQVDVLPHDAPDLSATGWTYQVVVTLTSGSPRSRSIDVLVPLGDGTPIDLDLLLPIDASTGLPTPGAGVLSIAGLFGDITGAQLTAAIDFTAAAQVAANAVFDEHEAAADPHPGYVTPARGDLRYAALAAGISSDERAALVGLGAALAGKETAGAAVAAVGAHEAASDPHAQYLTPAEGAGLYEATGAAASAVSGHAAATDPHPGYLTPAEGAGLYEPTGAAAAAVGAHAAALDPHPEYLKPAEGGALYTPAGAGLVWVAGATDTTARTLVSPVITAVPALVHGYAIEADLVIDASFDVAADRLGLACLSGSTERIRAELHGTRTTVSITVLGVQIATAAVPAVSNGTHTLRLIVLSGTAHLYLDGTRVLSVAGNVGVDQLPDTLALAVFAAGLVTGAVTRTATWTVPLLLTLP